MSGQTVIASRTLLARDEHGVEFKLTAAIGAPYEISESEGACPVSMEGLYERLHDMHGVDSWQALQEAFQLIARLLVCFVEDGGQLFDPDNRAQVMPRELFPQIPVKVTISSSPG